MTKYIKEKIGFNSKFCYFLWGCYIVNNYAATKHWKIVRINEITPLIFDRQKVQNHDPKEKRIKWGKPYECPYLLCETLFRMMSREQESEHLNVLAEFRRERVKWGKVPQGEYTWVTKATNEDNSRDLQRGLQNTEIWRPEVILVYAKEIKEGICWVACLSQWFSGEIIYAFIMCLLV